MEAKFGKRFYELDQMFGCVMGQDDVDEFAGPFEAVAYWVDEAVSLQTCERLLEELRQLYVEVRSPAERRAVFVRSIAFLAADGTDFDAVMSEVERRLLARLAAAT